MKLDEYINERCARDPKFQYEYDALEIEYQLKQALVEMRKNKNLTQKELAELTGIHQADISKIENCNANPSLSTIRRLAKGLGKKLKIEFVDCDVVDSHPICVAEP